MRALAESGIGRNMVGMSHVFLHVGLCSTVARLAPDTQIAMRVGMSYRVGGAEVDKVFRFARGDGPQTVIEFDVPRAVYHLQINIPKYGCTGSDFIDILPDRNRTITETLDDGAPGTPPGATPPVELISGTAPVSFLYVKPTFVLFDKTVTCAGPVQTPIPLALTAEYDQGAYFAWLRPDSSLDSHAPVVVALRLRTTTGSAHYVRIPIQFPVPWGGWPTSNQLNITEDMIDGLATEKVDTLLCLKFWVTSVH